MTITGSIFSSQFKRVTIFAPDTPYPANRGGRADVWRRILALRQLGFDVQLICFFDDLDGKRPSPHDVKEIESVVSSFIAYPIKKGRWLTLQRLPRILERPWHVVCRSLDKSRSSDLASKIRNFAPSLLWCEGVWMAATAWEMSRLLHLSLVYRSHNIEHLYMPRQAAAARRMRDRVAWTIACYGLRRFEYRVLARASWVFDISDDDMAFWKAAGVVNISWLPPVAEGALKPLPPVAAERNDVVFLGNLTTPNNVRGVQWLVEKIWPLVRAARPATQLVVAGSNPGPFVRKLCEAPGVVLMPNVADALGLYVSARVLVNPVRTGSGTHIKAIEMLMMGAPIVTATQGTMGMPPEVKRLFTVADTAETFADAILQALESPRDLTAQRALARQTFGVEGLARAMSDLQQRLLPQAGAGGSEVVGVSTA